MNGAGPLGSTTRNVRMSPRLPNLRNRQRYTESGISNEIMSTPSFRIELYKARLQSHPTFEKFIEDMTVADMELFFEDMKTLEASTNARKKTMEALTKQVDNYQLHCQLSPTRFLLQASNSSTASSSHSHSRENSAAGPTPVPNRPIQFFRVLTR
jgi:hypothetical protein